MPNSKMQGCHSILHNINAKCSLKQEINEYISTFHSFDPKQQGKGKGCFTFALASTKAP